MGLGFELLKLIIATMMPITFAVGLTLAKRHSPFGKTNPVVQQIVIGICFGCIAIFATEFGSEFSGAVLNVRNAAPLTAGLAFGWPAGIISGIIGAIGRWFSESGDFTRLACTIATLVAGLLGGVAKKFLMENHTVSWLYGLVLGATSEVIHMLLVFITNSDEIYRAFDVVKGFSVPMIVANGISVMLALFCATLVDGKLGFIENNKKEYISQTFQRWLVIVVVLAFSVTLLFTNTLQTQISYTTADVTLETNINDIKNDIRDTSNRNLLSITKKVAEDLSEEPTEEELFELAEIYDVPSINIVNKDGYIILSTMDKFYGYNMYSGDQSSEFMILFNGKTEFVQDYQPMSYDNNTYSKYAGVRLDEEHFLQVGYYSKQFEEQLNEQVLYVAQNRHVGQGGYILICNENGEIVSDLSSFSIDGKITFEDVNLAEIKEGERFSATIQGVPSFCMYTMSEAYYIIGIISQEEVFFSKDISVYLLAFMETLVYSTLFAFIFIIIKLIVVHNVNEINDSLNEITNGNLDVTVDVRSNAEFDSLSDGINATVSTLKHYIDEAAARFDKDLEIAKQIQHSSIPSVFPPYPNRNDFSIFASMDAAKEVGGDFYDFYLLNDKTLAFVMADVSGKGIPGAMFMMTTKTLIKGYAETGIPVNEIFMRVNEKLCSNNEAGMFVTAWMGILDLSTGKVSYTNAGHNPPIIKRKNGETEYLRGKVNFVLAGMENVRYVEQQLQLYPGDKFFLYTDGVTEAHNINKELFGEKRLLETIRNSTGIEVKGVCDMVTENVESFVGEADQFDDITMLCIRLNRIDSSCKIETEPTEESVAVVSDFVEENLKKLYVPVKTVNRMMIALDEIYSNIVHYSGATKAEVIIEEKNNVIKLIFCDNGKPYNPWDTEDPDITASSENRSVGGLGIYMVRNMMDDVGYEYIHGFNKLTLVLNFVPEEK